MLAGRDAVDGFRVGVRAVGERPKMGQPRIGLAFQRIDSVLAAELDAANNLGCPLN